MGPCHPVCELWAWATAILRMTVSSSLTLNPEGEQWAQAPADPQRQGLMRVFVVPS